jgi:predicted RND superfamily exporter protein
MKTTIRLLARLVERFPVAVLVASLSITGVFGWLATDVQVASGQDGFAPESDEILAASRIGELFGDDAIQSVMQVIVRSEGGDVISPEGYAVARSITEALLDSEFADILATNGGRPPIVSYLAPVELAAAQAGLDPATLDDATFSQLYTQALDGAGDELGFVRQLVPAGTTDATSEVGLLLVFLETTPDFNLQVDRELAVAQLLRGLATDTIEVRPFTFTLLFEDGFEFEEELGRLFGAAFAIIVALLLFVFWMRPVGNASRLRSVRRALADTGVTMATILLAIVWMQGAGGLLQRLGLLGELTEVAQIVPILIIGLGVDYGIHLTSRYRDEVGSGSGVTLGATRAIGTVGVALVLATVTTAIGFLANIVNPIPALADFGILASLGIIASFLLMLTFVPALRVLLDRRAERAGRLPTDGMGATSSRLLPQLIGRTSFLAVRMPVPTLAVMLVLGGFGWYGLSNISTEFSFTDFLPDDAPFAVTLEIIQDEFGGGFGETTQVLVEGDAIAEPDGFNALVDAIEAMGDTPDVLVIDTPAGTRAQVRSPASVVQSLFLPGPDGMPSDPLAVQAALAAGFDPATGRIAPDGDVLALLEAAAGARGTELATVVAFQDGRPTAALLEVATQAGEGAALPLRDALLEDLAPVMAAGLTTIVTSQYVITGTITDALVDSQVSSLLITLIVATLVLMVSFGIENRRPFLGVVTMAPVALVVLWTFGLMYLSGIPFGPVTATLTGLAVGIGVPYTIHIARRFEEDRSRYADIADAIRATMTNTGGALAGSALTTAAGFGILVTSTLTPFRQLGQVVAYAILLSLAGAVLVLPSLLVLWERWHRRHGLPPSGRPTRALVGADGARPSLERREPAPRVSGPTGPSGTAPADALASDSGRIESPIARSSTSAVARRVAASLLAVVVARRVLASLRRR